MKRTTLISLIVHAGLLGLLLFFGTRQLSTRQPEVVAPTEIIDEAEFDARVEEQVAATQPEANLADVEEPSAPPVDDIQMLRDRIREEMERREEEMGIEGELPLPNITPDPEPAPKPTPKPKPQQVASTSQVNDLAPRSATVPTTRPQTLNRVEVGASQPAPVNQNVVENAQESTDEIAALIGDVITDNSTTQTAPVIPPSRGTLNTNISSTASAQNAPSEAAEVAITVAAETVNVQTETTPVASATAPTSAIRPPSRSASNLNTVITQLVKNVVNGNSSGSNVEVSDVVDETRDEIAELAASLIAGKATPKALAPSFAILPPARN